MAYTVHIEATPEERAAITLQDGGQHSYLKLALAGGASATLRIGQKGVRLTVYPYPATTERAVRAYTFAQAGADTVWVANDRELGGGHWLHTFHLGALADWTRSVADELLAAVAAGRVLTDRQQEAAVAPLPEQSTLTGTTIAAKRATLGLTQQQFADRLGISIGTLRNWEQDRTTARLPGMVQRAIDAL